MALINELQEFYYVFEKIFFKIIKFIIHINLKSLMIYIYIYIYPLNKVYQSC